MYTEVFSPDSKVNHFNRAVKQVKEDSRCTALLGNSKKITAYGEPTWNKWARARPIAYVTMSSASKPKTNHLKVEDRN